MTGAGATPRRAAESACPATRRVCLDGLAGVNLARDPLPRGNPADAEVGPTSLPVRALNRTSEARNVLRGKCREAPLA